MAARPSSGVVAAARVFVVCCLLAVACAVSVSQSTGSDGTSCACPSGTCQSLKCGISIAALGENINVLAGTYSGSLNRGLSLTKPVRIIGASQASVVIDLGAADRFMTLGGWNYATGSIIANVTIINGKPSATGGALNIYDGAPVVQNVLFKNCVSSSDGGAIDISNSSVTIIGCTFDSNTGLGNGVGGAIHTAFNWAGWGQRSLYPVVMISNCTFTRNSAPHGGALGLDGDAIVTDSLITLNSATVSCGGGVRIASTMYTVAFRNTVITKNNATSTAGGISVRFTNQISGSTYYYGFIEIENCTFSGNTNGGLDMYSSCAFITGTTFDTFNCNTEYAGTVLVDWRYPNRGASMTGGCLMSNVTAPNLTAVNDSNAQSSAYQMTVVGRTFTQTLSGNQLTLRGSASQSATCALKQANTGSLNADCSGVEAGYYCLSVLIYKKESNALNYTRYPYLTAISPTSPTNGNTATLTGVGFSAAGSARTPSVYLGATAQTVLGWDAGSITIRVVGTPTQGLASFCAVMNGVPSSASCAAYGSTAPRCNSTTTTATTTTSTTSPTSTTSSTSSTTSTTSTTSSSATASTSSTTNTTSSSSSSSTSSTSTTATPSTSSTTSTTTSSSSTSSTTTAAAPTSSTTSTTGSTSTSSTSSTSSSTSTTSSASTSSTTSTTSSSGSTSTTGTSTTTSSSTSTTGNTNTTTVGSSTPSTTSTTNSSTSSTSGTASSTTAASPSTTSAGAQTATTSSAQGSSTSTTSSDSTSSSTAPSASSTTDSTTNSADGLSTSTTSPRDALGAALDSIDENRRTAIIAGSVVGGAVLLAILIVVLILLIGSMRRATKAGSGRHSARVAPVVPGDGGAQELAVAEFDEGEYKSREDMLRDRQRGDSAGGGAGGASAGGGGTTPRPTDVSIMIGGTEVSVSIGKQ